MLKLEIVVMEVGMGGRLDATVTYPTEPLCPLLLASI